MSNDNGGPAFPTDRALQTKGMTLRDYFAAKALGGILADPSSSSISGEGVVALSYEYADAMLKERAK